MKSKQQVFFLTKSDLIKMMSVVEEKVPFLRGVFIYI